MSNKTGAEQGTITEWRIVKHSWAAHAESQAASCSEVPVTHSSYMKLSRKPHPCHTFPTVHVHSDPHKDWQFYCYSVEIQLI